MEKTTTNLRDRLLIRLLFRLGCRVSEALALTVGDMDFDHGTITIKHLKTRLKLACPDCGARLGRSHAFCPKCGVKVEKAVAQAKEHRRMRALPVDSETLSRFTEDLSWEEAKAFCNNNQKILALRDDCLEQKVAEAEQLKTKLENERQVILSRLAEQQRIIASQLGERYIDPFTGVLVI